MEFISLIISIMSCLEIFVELLSKCFLSFKINSAAFSNELSI